MKHMFLVCIVSCCIVGLIHGMDAPEGEGALRARRQAIEKAQDEETGLRVALLRNNDKLADEKEYNKLLSRAYGDKDNKLRLITEQITDAKKKIDQQNSQEKSEVLKLEQLNTQKTNLETEIFSKDWRLYQQSTRILQELERENFELKHKQALVKKTLDEVKQEEEKLELIRKQALAKKTLDEVKQKMSIAENPAEEVQKSAFAKIMSPRVLTTLVLATAGTLGILHWVRKR